MLALTKEPSVVSGHGHVGSNGLVLVELPPGRSITSLFHTILIGVVVVCVLPSEYRRPVGTQSKCSSKQVECPEVLFMSAATTS